MMISDDERREVARRLREPFDVIGQGRYVALNGTLFGMQLLAGDEGTLRAGIACLADLIEPSCDRDALLAMAGEMEEFGNLPVKHPGVCVLHNEDFSRELGYARRIRKALGATGDAQLG